jgi:transposase
MTPSILYVGLDVHAESISVAVAESGPQGEVREHGRIPGDLAALDKLLTKLRDGGRELRICYEAGPCGFTIARHLRGKNLACLVAAPSLIPRAPGERVRTDRRDARKLARLHRAGELTAVHVPDPADEALRDLCRARTDAVADLRRVRCQLKAFLLRNGLRKTCAGPWGEAHKNSLRKLGLRHPAMGTVLEEYIAAADAAGSRIARLETAMEAQLPHWPQKETVHALMGLRGFRIIAAMITVSELGDIHRFAHPRQLMSYLGLVPSEASSGESRWQGRITKAGNPHLRWLLNESAQHYRLPPKISQGLAARQAHIAEKHRARVREISWKCQQRLYERGRALSARQKMRQKVQITLARELCGFIWAVMKAVQPAPAPANP